MGDGSDEIRYDLNDFRRQLVELTRIGPLREILGQVPGLNALVGGPSELELDLDTEIRRIQGIIDSMTPEERRTPRLIDGPRRRRIAAGSGVNPAEVSSLLRQFEAMATLVRQMAAMTAHDPLQGPEPDEAGGQLARTIRNRGTRLPDRRRPPGRLPRRASGPADEVRRLGLDRPMSAEERVEFRRLWEVLARAGRRPAGEEPWFSLWNRNLRLWDFIDD